MTKKLIFLCMALILWISPRAVSAHRLGLGRFDAALVAPMVRTDPERIAALEQQVAEAKG